MNDQFTLLQGDCLDVLRTLPDASVDSVVTDPPAGIGFMGKDWDHHKGGRDQWTAWMTDVAAECLRVLKPGGHALVWAIPRTSHWTATAWEDAGFEIRDRIAHVFGSGFPKSLDVSKALDKAAGAEREVVGVRKVSRDFRDVGRKSIEHHGIDKIAPGTESQSTGVDITAPSTEAAKQWEGWGTALKPAMEDWWLCRKPLTGTVAQNVMEHGAGALNIDGCRVASPDANLERIQNCRTKQSGDTVSLNIPGHSQPTYNSAGRFPANLIHDGSTEVLELFPVSNSGNGRRKTKERNSMGFHGGESSYDDFNYGDAGSAARFFYCAKASKADRGQGNVHPTVKPTALMRYLCRLITPPGGTILDPFMGSGSTGKAAMLEGFKFIGIEKEEEYTEIAQARITHAALETPTTQWRNSTMQPEIKSIYQDKLTDFIGVCTHWTQYVDRVEAYLESEQHGARYFDMRRLASMGDNAVQETPSGTPAVPDAPPAAPAAAQPGPAPAMPDTAAPAEMSADELRIAVKDVMEKANTMDTALLRNQLMVFGAPTIPKVDPARRAEFLRAVKTSYGVAQ